MTDDTDASPLSFYDEVGGHETFVRLVDGFYRGVATDEVLKPMYPEEDLGPAAERLTLFLEQYWGGPTTYSERRGHPRLRHMRASLDELDLPPLHEATLWDYLERAAMAMVNTFEASPIGPPSGGRTAFTASVAGPHHPPVPKAATHESPPPES